MSAKGMDHPNYKHGFRAGYTEYRYGDVSVKNRQEPIFDPKQYASVVERITAILGNWTSSPFQNEGACRKAVREQLCLKGFSWGRSDAEASRIVAAGLSNLRAIRPSHDEGQPQFSVSTDYCLHCHSALDDHDLLMKRRFCSSECAKATMLFRNYEVGYWADKIGQAAFLVVQRAKHAARSCKHCNESFRPIAENSGQIFCSKTCSAASQVTIPDKPCETCGTMFRPHSSEEGRFCSRTCKDKALTNFRATKHCTFCGESFVARGQKAAFCSIACSVASSKMNNGWSPVRLVPHVFDHFFTVPINAAPRRITAERFDEMLAA